MEVEEERVKKIKARTNAIFFFNYRKSGRNWIFKTQRVPQDPPVGKEKKYHRRWKNYIHIYISIPKEILQTEIYHR